ncbi:universal stress protein [Natrinema gelatinilyticum]|uniref:universal stress protein n=1 Tax=Natrinema gelatinilyticum TaxID=2961571 RepID=UPI0020C46ECE|nr:universal stress protein [Natrinema gelatinilyticum]
MKAIVLGIDQNADRAASQAETVIDLFDIDNICAYLLHDFADNPEGASVIQVDAVKRAQELLEDAGVAVELREGSGDPARSIIETANKLDADAICVAGRNRSPAGKVLFGSVTQSVVLNTDRPVLICGDRQ